MSSPFPLNDIQFSSFLPRVCLPYRLDLLEIARWFAIGSNNKNESEFDIFVGDNRYKWSGTDVIDLFNNIQTLCINYKLASSYVICNITSSLFFFDLHDRFSFFSGEQRILQSLYPFSREIMWENFAFWQEEDDTMLKEIFEIVHSA